MRALGMECTTLSRKKRGVLRIFLLHYDSIKANEGDNSWLTQLIAQDTLNTLSSPEVWEAMNTLGISGLDFGSSSIFFDSQVFALKMQLFEAFSQRDDYEEMEPLLKQLLS